jgi:hypothetical protein
MPEVSFPGDGQGREQPPPAVSPSGRTYTTRPTV